MLHKKNMSKNYGAFGLLESVVAIGVFGVTIIMGLSLIVKSLRIIKDNQISDQAASVMISSLEYARSPSLSPSSIEVGRYYSVKIDSEGKVEEIELVPGGSPLTESSSCSSTSPFYNDIDGADSAGVFCNQIAVELTNPLRPDSSSYLIRSRIVYRVSDGFKFRESVGFKHRGL